ncbi:MAG TPA: hypothetical protein DDY68_03580 [Porphyromonadaceae bacterium]|nr:hypothetical protein [Porphyromonadaceae bacterium]
MELPIDLKELRAEVLLNYLYPEKTSQWIARYEGTFYRNYSNDILSCDEEKDRVSVSRDGFLKLLPQGLLTTDDGLRKGDFEEKYKKEVEELKLLQDVFQPFDTIRFRKSVEIEKQISDLLASKEEYFINKFSQWIRIERNNRFIKPLLHLLPQIHRHRGNMGRIGELIGIVTGYKVEMKYDKYQEYERAKCSIPCLSYILVIEDLDVKKFADLGTELKPFFDFMLQWFVPFDVMVEFKIKHLNKIFDMNDEMILDYNTEIDEPLLSNDNNKN